MRLSAWSVGNSHGGQRFAGSCDSYFTQGQYTHVVWTKAGETCKFYKNGVQTDTTSCPTHVDLNELYTIGLVDNFFTGVIDEVSMYDFSVGDSDASAMYTATATANGASAMYLFNGNADDASGSNTGIIAGGITSCPDRCARFCCPSGHDVIHRFCCSSNWHPSSTQSGANIRYFVTSF